VVLEIGPGRGAITSLLAAGAAHVIAFEIDRDLVVELRRTVPANVTVVEGDFLAQTGERIKRLLTDLRLPSGPLRVAGNLPYNVAAPILFLLLRLRRQGLPLSDGVVMLQREVADRLTARPGSRDYGVLTVLMGLEASVRRLLALPPGAFRPPPKVHSAVVGLAFHDANPRPHDAAAFEALVKSIFTRRRKTLANALQAYRQDGGDDALVCLGLDGRRRPETLSIAELVALSNALA
jgi:16S rRNA (adenine1518-N6/adenine1519-N6)-dimethyltransferase